MTDDQHARNPVWFTVAAIIAFIPVLFLGATIIDILWDIIGHPGGNPASANSVARNVLGICFGFLLFYYSYRWAESFLKKKG